MMEEEKNSQDNGAPDYDYEEEQNEDDIEETRKHERQEKIRQKIITAVNEGNIRVLEDISEDQEFDINITWYQENLLMQAIRAQQVKVAAFLIYSGIDYNFSKMVLDYDRESGIIDCYTVNCRQLAYEQKLFQIVELIDIKNKETFPIINPYSNITPIYIPKMKKNKKKDLEIKIPSITENREENTRKINIKKQRVVTRNILGGNYNFHIHSFPSIFTLSLRGNNSEILFIQSKCRAGHSLGERCLSVDEISRFPFILRNGPQKYKACFFLPSDGYNVSKSCNYNGFCKKPFMFDYHRPEGKLRTRQKLPLL